MRKLVPFVIAICTIAAPAVFGQEVQSVHKANEREAVFSLDNDAKVMLRFCSPTMVRVEYAFDGSFLNAYPTPAVVDDQLEPMNIDIHEDGTGYEVFTGAVRVCVDKNPFAIRMYDAYQRMLAADVPGGYYKEGDRIICTKRMDRRESFFGLGEKGGLMERRGGLFTMWNSDKPCYAVDEDPLYKSIPFFMSSRGYGLFFDNSWKSTFDFTKRDSYTVEADGGAMVYYLFAGEDYKSLLQQYIALTGRPVMPPLWALGFSQCRGLYTYEKQALEVGRTFRELEIPCDIIYQDIGWTQYLQDFIWKEENYSNPRAMLDSLHSLGFHVIVSQDPVISQRNTVQWEEADRLGLFAKDKRTGKSYDMPWPWGGRCGVVDFTHPDAAAWWGAYQQRAIDDGVDGFWTDMGEPAWSNEDEPDRLNMVHVAGEHAAIHNVYGLYWDRVVTEEYNRRNPDKRLFQMTRAAFSGMQRYCFSWTGDSGSAKAMTDSWEQFAYQIPMMLSAGLGGIPFITGDITGYCGPIESYTEASELYVRWMQFGLFTPLSRAHHEGNTAVEPWQFTDDAIQAARKAIELKYTLLPYIYTCAREAYDTGLPLMRAMFLEFPKDRECLRTDMQFMFGSSLLVAPVYEEGARTREVYLPKGKWYDWYDGTVYEGGHYVTVNAPLDRIPLFVRAGSIIPTAPVRQHTGENTDYPLTYRIYPNGEKAFSYELYEDDGTSLGYQRGEFARTRIECSLAGETLLIRADAPVCSGGFAAPQHQEAKYIVPVSAQVKKIIVNGKRCRKHKSEQYLTT